MPAIRDHLEELRRIALRWSVLRGLGAGISVLLFLALGLVCIDWLFRWQSSIARWGQSGLWLFGAGFVLWWYLIRPLRYTLSFRELAQAVHRKWITETPDLISAVEFEQSGVSDIVGAPQLQQISISRAQLQLARIPIRSLVDRAPAWKMLGAAALAMLLASVWYWLDPETLSVGTTRLLSPGGNMDWPRRTTLVYLDAELQPIDLTRDPAIRAAQGDPLIVYVENREGALPSAVKYEKRSSRNHQETGELRQTTLRDAKGLAHQVGVVSLPTSEPFEFRVSGGDDHRAPWLSVEVVTPPRIEQFHISITPPAYSGRATETLDSGVGHLQGLVGSQVKIRCRSLTPLKSATVNRGNEPRQPMTLDSSGREFEWNWTIASEERSSYWVDLLDLYDLRIANPPRYEIRGIADREPVVTISNPASDLRVTPEAVIDILGDAKDDLGLARIELAYEMPSPSDPAAGTTIHTIPIELKPSTTEMPHILDQAVQLSWDLTSLNLTPGQQVRFWLQGTDQYDLNGATGQTGRSATRILSVLSEPDKRQELAGRQVQLAEQIARLRDKQQALAETTRELGQQWKAVGELRPSEQIDLDRVQTDQRQLAQDLSTAPRGVMTELQSLQNEIARNRLTAPEISQSLGHWEEALKPLTEKVLPEVEQKLDAVRQAVSSKPGTQSPPKDRTAADLNQALAGQQQTLDELNQLSNELSQWQREQDLETKFAEIAGKQASLREQSLKVGEQTSGKTVPDLSSQEQADLARAADRQTSLARDVEQLANQLVTAAQKAEYEGPQNEALGEMAKRLNEQSVAATMRSISDELRQNHVQSATEAQQKLLDSLDEMRKDMDRNQSQSAQSDVEELRKASQDIQNLQNRQEEMIKRTEGLASSQTADPHRTSELEELKKLQQEITQQTSQLAQKLRREQRRNASQSAQRAQQRMQEAQETLEEEDFVESVAREREALDELQQAQDEVEQELASAEQRAQQQELSAAGILVTSLLERAKTNRNETVRLEELRLSTGKWTRSQLKSVQQTAEAQKQIAEGVRTAGKDLGSEGVLQLCLELATEHLGDAAARLVERDAGQGTQTQQLAGESLLQQFLTSIESPDPTSQPPQQAGEQQTQPGEDGEGPSQASNPFLAAEIRLLLGMQEGLLENTRRLADLKSQGHELTTDQLAEVKQLHQRQKRLAETARKMVQQEAAEVLP